MSHRSVERGLRQVAKRLAAARQELGILDEQRVHLASDADDARLHSLVAETPGADRAHRSAARHVGVVDRRRQELIEEIASLERRQDELLDEFTA